MARREKRLKKGIESLNLQREIHKNKMQRARENDKLDLESYYKKEIRSIEGRIKDRKAKPERK